MNLRNNLKALRRDRRLTQDSFSQEVGIKRSLIGAYEEGRSNPSVENLLKIADYFGITADELLRGETKDTSCKGMIDELSQRVESVERRLDQNGIYE